MPSVSTQNSPREAYPFRAATGISSGISFGAPPSADQPSKLNTHTPYVQSASSTGSLPASAANSPTPLSNSNASSAFQFRDSAFRDSSSFRESAFRDAGMRDLPISPGPRGSVGSSTVVGSRGSLSSLASIGTISTRASMGSVGSFSSGDSTSLLGSDSTIGMWHNNSTGNGEDPPIQSNLISSGGLPTAPPSASSISASKLPLSANGAVGGNLVGPSNSNASLQVTCLPRDLTLRECHFLFALAPDFVSVEMNRNAVSGEIALVAKFSSFQSAQAAAQAFERRNDLFGYEVKASVQTFAAPFSTGVGAGAPSSQAQTTQPQPRNLYSSRSFFAESYWSQQPGTPMSPSTTSDIFSNSRRASLISPTDHPHLGHATLVPNSPSHHAQNYEGTHPHPGGSDYSATFLASNGTSPNTTGSSNVSSNAHSGAISSNSNAASNTGSPTSETSPAGSAVFPQPVSQHSTGSISPSSKVVPSSVVSPLSGSAPISSSSVSKSSAPIGSSVSQSIQQVSQSQGEASNSLNMNSFRQQSVSSQSPPGTSNQADPSKFPPPNPADQNPPCNTLYVGNLPPDTSENELKGLFSRQPGYRRLCFRTKQNGPMCFVEFEDEKLAGRALSELYGVALSNSVKGGIRLSYSKNPLGVRSRTVRSK